MPQPRVFACNWSLFPLMDSMAAARFAAREGFAGIELECDPLGFWPTTLPPSTIAELASICWRLKFHCSTIISAEISPVHAPDDLNPATALPDQKARDGEIMRRLVELARRLASPVVGIHPGVVEALLRLERKGNPFDSPRFDRRRLTDEARRRAVETYVRWADLAAEASLVLTIENEVHVRHTVAPTAEILAALIDETGRADIKVNLDTGHALIGGGLAQEFEVLRRRIVHVHLNDGRTMGVSEHLPLGEGVADFAPLAAFMAGFAGALVLEIYAPERPVEATLESRDRLMRMIAAA